MKTDIKNKSALRGEPSYVWRAGQQRRFDMIVQAAGSKRLAGAILDNGCGIGLYVEHLLPYEGQVVGIEFDFPRAVEAKSVTNLIASAEGETLPFPSDYFDLILSHEVIEHVQSDENAVKDMVRVLKPGGRMVVFCPNRGYPFETHGIYWKGKYQFGNIPLINYLPTNLRNRLAPHVKVYTSKDMQHLFGGLPIKIIQFGTDKISLQVA